MIHVYYNPLSNCLQKFIYVNAHRFTLLPCYVDLAAHFISCSSDTPTWVSVCPALSWYGRRCSFVWHMSKSGLLWHESSLIFLNHFWDITLKIKLDSLNKIQCIINFTNYLQLWRFPSDLEVILSANRHDKFRHDSSYA